MLHITVGELMAWMQEHMKPDDTQWSLWTRRRRELPEPVIRLYLMSQSKAETSYQRELREIKELLQSRQTAPAQTPATEAEPQKKRAAGGRR